MQSGFLNVLKPPGMTSHDVVDFVRRRIPKGIKVGHLGTLDPGASGVLPLAIGQATRLIPQLPPAAKSYLAEVWFGRTSDTWDVHGEIHICGIPTQGGSREGGLSPYAEVPAPLSDLLPPLLEGYRGTIMQVPPQVSALKRDGKRGYERARAGEEFAFEPRPAHYESVRLRATHGERAWLEVSCGPGTYVRALAHELGQKLGCGALLSALIRTSSGRFRLEGAATLEELLRQPWPILPPEWPFEER